jgi:hypothetical protein
VSVSQNISGNGKRRVFGTFGAGQTTDACMADQCTLANFRHQRPKYRFQIHLAFEHSCFSPSKSILHPSSIWIRGIGSFIPCARNNVSHVSRHQRRVDRNSRQPRIKARSTSKRLMARNARRNDFCIASSASSEFLVMARTVRCTRREWRLTRSSNAARQPD